MLVSAEMNSERERVGPLLTELGDPDTLLNDLKYDKVQCCKKKYVIMVLNIALQAVESILKALIFQKCQYKYKHVVLSHQTARTSNTRIGM
jgi:hypothetical protein